jgi:protein involved in temperature-dependent protein secretion
VSLDDLVFRTRGVTPEERAAVEVVLDAMIDEESAEEYAVGRGRQTPWQRSQLAVRDGVEARHDFGVDYPR